MSTDREVWEYAGDHDCAIASKDSDFGQLAFLYGHPPKVIWLRVGNQSTRPIADQLRASVELIGRFNADPDDALLVLPGLPSRPTT